METPCLQRVPGLRLPHSEAAWGEAHAYFCAYPPLPEAFDDLDSCASTFQENIYNYFKNNFGYHSPRTNNKPAPLTLINSANRKLRRRLHALKATADLAAFKAASHALRQGLKAATAARSADAINNNNARRARTCFFSYKENPWKFMKDYNKTNNLDPTFPIPECENYFANILAEKNPKRVFIQPEWMPNYPPPYPLLSCLTPLLPGYLKNC